MVMELFFSRIRKVKKMKKLVPHEGTSISRMANGRGGHRRVINSFHFLKRINSDKMSF